MNGDRDRHLVELWSRCAGRDAGGPPTEDDWKQLFMLVRQVLGRCNAPELLRLPGDRADYIDEFFTEKVFLPIRPGLRGPDHCGALVVFFRRYLRGLHLGADAGTSSLQESSDSPQPPEPPASEAFRELDEVLREGCGRSTDQVSSSALAFLAGLQAEEEWAWLMLRHGFCPDAGERTPLIRLAQSHRIPAYHHRAGRLGINHQWDVGLEAFRGTMLGTWLEHALGERISSENAECVQAALEILCFHALRE